LYGTIIEANSQPIKDLEDFIDVMNKTKPGDEMRIKTECCTYSLKAIEDPSNSTKPYIGIQNATTKFIFTGFLKGFGEVSYVTLEAIDWIVNLFLWLNFLNLGVGMINLLPLKPLDGGLMFEEIFKMIFKKRYSPYLINILSAFTFVLLAINIIGPYLVGPITSVFLISKFLTG
jgi:membrane-associated protease RseP (regulator of RpoE activity)